MVYHSRLGLAMINVSTKFVVVNSIHYEDTKGDTECRKCGCLGYLGHFHLAPWKGVTPLQSRQDLWRQKTSVRGISHGVVCMIPRLTILVQYQHVTAPLKLRPYGAIQMCILLLLLLWTDT